MARPVSYPRRAAASRRKVKAPDAPAHFGCLYIPQFPVWAARFVDAALHEAPLIIYRNETVLAMCPVAARLGVRVGWSLARAQSLCPEAKLKADDPCQMISAWQEVLLSMYNLTPRVESMRPGLLFFDPPQATSASWHSTLKALDALARQWKVLMTIAADRATAELAVHAATSARLCHVKNADHSLQKVSCNLLTEVGLSASAAQRLQWFGFNHIVDLRVLSREQIAAQFASVTSPQDAALLWRFSRAGTADAERRPIPQYQLPPLCKARLVLEQAATYAGEWEEAIAACVKDAAEQLNGLQAGMLTLQLETQHGLHIASKQFREVLSAPRPLTNAAHELAYALLTEEEEVQTIEICLSLITAGDTQSALFEVRRYDVSMRHQCPRKLQVALRNIESRCSSTMWRWRQIDAYAPLPEEQYSLTPALEFA